MQRFRKYTFKRDGTIVGPSGKELNSHYCRKGYCRVNLKDADTGKKRAYLRHRLIAEKFIPNPECKPQVNHKDGNKDNNSVDNLEWVTNLENNRHSSETGLTPRGDKRPNSKLSDSQVRSMRQLRKLGCTYYDLGVCFGISYQSAHRVCTGQTYTHVV